MNIAIAPRTYNRLINILSPVAIPDEITLPIFKGKQSAHCYCEEIEIADYLYNVIFDATWDPVEDECKDVDILFIERCHLVNEDNYYPQTQIDNLLFIQLKRLVMIWVDENIDSLPWYYNGDKTIKITQSNIKN